MTLVFVNCQVNFDWLPDITNFTLLGARHLCFLVNLLQLFLGMLFSYLECIWSSWILLLKDLLSGTGVGLSLWLIVLYCRSKTPTYSMVLYQCLINYEVSDLMSGNRKFPALGKLGGSFWVVLPPASGIFLICMHWSQYSVECLRGTLQSSRGFSVYYLPLW